MNFKRFSAATVALLVFFVLYEWLVHGYLLMPIYRETPHVWRTMEEMNANMPLTMFLQVCFAAWLTFVFTQIFPTGGLKNGIKYGIYIGVLMAFLSTTWYLCLPVSEKLGWSWFANGIVEGLAAGIILGAIYKKDEGQNSASG